MIKGIFKCNILLLLFVLPVSAKFQTIQYRNCRSVFDIMNVEIDGCVGNAQRLCAFKTGTTPQLRIKFVPNDNLNMTPTVKNKGIELKKQYAKVTKNLQTSVRAKLAGNVIIPFNLEENDPCKGGNLTCPLQQGVTYYYQQGVNILKEYPTVDNVQINWLISDKSNNETSSDAKKREICIIFLIKIMH